MEKKTIKLYGCPDCGSEMTAEEIISTKGKCLFCCRGWETEKGKPREYLEYLGKFSPEELVQRK